MAEEPFSAEYKKFLGQVFLLLKAGVDWENRAPELLSGLVDASSIDDYVKVAHFVQNSKTASTMPHNNIKSLLVLAAYLGQYEVARLLLKHGANLETISKEGFTALMAAAEKGYEEISSLLIRNGAQVNAIASKSDNQNLQTTALIVATHYGHQGVVDLLIKAGADVNLGTSTTPLIAASAKKDEKGLEIVRLLLSAGAKVNQTVKSFSNQTALSVACMSGATEVVKILLQSGADFLHRLKDDSTMFMVAANNGHTAIVQMLIEFSQKTSSEQSISKHLSKLNIHSPQDNLPGTQTATTQPAPPPTVLDLLSQTNSDLHTAFTLACAGGHVDMVRLLLAQGANIEHRVSKESRNGKSALMLAATEGHVKVVEVLLSFGAALEAQSELLHDTALSIACMHGKLEVAEMLLAAGANKEHRNIVGSTPLFLAAYHGHVPIINLLLSYKTKINAKIVSNIGLTPLIAAVLMDHTEALKVLLDQGSEVNAMVKMTRQTALSTACIKSKAEVVALLVDRNADIEHRVANNSTPLMIAAVFGNAEAAMVLLDKGANVNAFSDIKDTALILAAKDGHDAVVNLLIEREASVNWKNKVGQTALWCACVNHHLEVVTTLVASGKCDVNSTDNKKISCLMAALRRGYVTIVEFLHKHGAKLPSDREIYDGLNADSEIDKKDLKNKVAMCSEVVRSVKKKSQTAEQNAAAFSEEIDKKQNATADRRRS